MSAELGDDRLGGTHLVAHRDARSRRGRQVDVDARAEADEAVTLPAGEPVWFGCDVGQEHFGESGILRVGIHDYRSLLDAAARSPDVDAVELNLSCPNIRYGVREGLIAHNEKATYRVVKAVRTVTRTTVIAKLSPNVTDIREFAKACEDAGADALSVVNTFIGMAIDVEKRRPRLRFRTGGLSGPAIKPIALRMVWEVCQAVKLPVIGIGGISSTEDALEFLIAGARAVQVGTANFYRPDASQRIALGLQEYCRSRHIDDINEIIGSLRNYE